MPVPLLSIVVDTYNHERFIEQAVTSVLEQGFSSSELEVIVVDDGSTDRTPDLLRKFEPRVTVIRQKNGGQASALNTGISHCHADIVSFLDADDWWARGKVQAVLEAFERHAEASAVGHGYFEVFTDSVPAEIFAPEKTCVVDLSSPEAARRASLGSTFLGTSKLSVRRQVLDQMGPIPIELIFAADYPIFMIALALGEAVLLDRPLCYYRLHNNPTGNSTRSHAVRSHHAKYVNARDFELKRFLLKFVPERLHGLGVPTAVIDALMESDRVEFARYQLEQGQGGRWKAIEIERRAFGISSETGGTGHRIFKTLVAALMLVLPPRLFYRLRAWYAKPNRLQQGIKYLRSLIFGDARPTAPPLFRRRPVLQDGTEDR